MKTWKKLLCVFLAAVMAAAFVGCGGENPDGGDDGARFVIGGIGPLTGDYANYGESTRNGAQIAVEEINAAGGVNGFRLVLNFQDSAGTAENAVAAYGKLMDDGMKVSLGATLSGENGAVVAEAKEDGILVLTPTASAKAAIEGNDNAFRLCFNDPSQGVLPADFIADNKLATKVAVFYQNDNDYSVGLFESFKTECAQKGIEIVSEQIFTKASATDFSAQINNIKSSGATLVFLPIYAAEAARFIEQAQNANLGMQYFGCDGLDGILNKISDAKLAEGLMILTPFSSDDPSTLVQNFVTAYKEKFGKAPDQFAADGYDAIYAIVAAMQKAGVTPETVDSKDFNANMVAAMTEVSVEGVTGLMSWSADGETTKPAKVMVIRDGAYVEFSSEK